MKKNSKFNLNIVKIKGIIGLLIFIWLIVEVKISHIINFNLPSLVWIILMVFSIWLMGDWFKTWFQKN
ncbi:hypothetical protein [Arcobacter arenosus]|uniref:hypothetical protein n=1 Tax=Arcobacter arenosus TaxID=2576037 RepID=UPI003BA8682F